MFIIMGLACLIPGIIYFSFFIYRLLTQFNICKKSRKAKFWVVVIVTLFSIPAANFMGIYGTTYFHLLIICGVLEIINLVLKRFNLFYKLFVCGCLPVVILVCLFTYGYFNMNHIVKTEYTISSDKIDELVIAQITDLHMSTTMGIEKLSAICEEISENNPNIVVLTGDIFDESTPLKDMEEACIELSKIKNTSGIYFVFGNHDSASYSMDAQFDEQDVRENLEANGIVVIEDEVVQINDVSIVGRKDAHYGNDNPRLSPETLLADVNKENFILILDHQPLDLELNADLGADLQLSGHTHGGQMFPMRQFEALYSDRLVYGLREINDFTAITSSGIAGWGYPIKTGAPSEYVIITIN